jgi:hypothetical protein
MFIFKYGKVDEELLALQKELDKEIDAQKEIAAERAELETSLKALDERDKYVALW